MKSILKKALHRGKNRAIIEYIGKEKADFVPFWEALEGRTKSAEYTGGERKENVYTECANGS